MTMTEMTTEETEALLARMAATRPTDPLEDALLRTLKSHKELVQMVKELQQQVRELQEVVRQQEAALQEPAVLIFDKASADDAFLRVRIDVEPDQAISLLKEALTAARHSVREEYRATRH